ncbi:MAG: hypothetical protein FWE85_05725, partial [Clostridiales bacterium]|nr:hypothetical protein [Clostridiales bacterium]
MRKEKTPDNRNDILFFTGLFLVMAVALTMSLSGVGLILGLAISFWHFLIAVAAGGALLFFFAKDKQAIIKRWAVIAGCLILIACIALAAFTFDYSYDGNAYHKEAIGALHEGWNPVYSELDSIYSDSYPKGSWFFAAALYGLTGSIESGKSINLIMIAACFLLVFFLLSKKSGKSILPLIIAALVSVTPVALQQAFSYYVDGLLASCLYITIFSLAAITMGGKSPSYHKSWFMLLFGSVLIAANIKFTGLAYCGLFCLAFYVYWIIGMKKPDLKKGIMRLSAFFLVLVVFSTCVVGYSSYVKNTAQHGHPFYPVMGKGSVDFITENQPSSFANKSGLRKLVISTFSYVDNAYSADPAKDRQPKFKIPFTVNTRELEAMAGYDTRISGFGPFFGGCLLLGILLFGLAFPAIRKLYAEKRKLFITLALI